MMNKFTKFLTSLHLGDFKLLIKSCSKCVLGYYQSYYEIRKKYFHSNENFLYVWMLWLSVLREITQKRVFIHIHIDKVSKYFNLNCTYLK